MKGIFWSACARYNAACIKTSTVVSAFIRDNATALLAIIGVVLLGAGLAELSIAQSEFLTPDYDDSQIRIAVGNLFGVIEGAFGALVMVVAGLGAIIAAAMGAYKAALGMLVVAVGAFILRSLVSVFFGRDFQALGI